MILKLSDQLENQLGKLAEKAGKSKDDYAYNILVEYLENMHDVEIAESRLKEIRSGKRKLISLEELEESLNLDN